jgi:nitrite reductase (NADH) small subunit
MSTGSEVKRHAVGYVHEFPAGKAHIVHAGGVEIGIYNVDSHLYAIRNYCPHRGAPLCLGRFGGTMLPGERTRLTYGLDERIITCPWHRWEWDVTTGCSPFAADKRRLIRYHVEVEDGRVFVQIGSREQDT